MNRRDMLKILVAAPAVALVKPKLGAAPVISTAIKPGSVCYTASPEIIRTGSQNLSAWEMRESLRLKIWPKVREGRGYRGMP